MENGATKYSGTAKVIGEMKVKRKIPNRSRILRKEDEKIPLVDIFKRMKRKREAMSSEDEEVCKRRKMIMEEKIPLADFYKMSRKTGKSIEDDGDITVMADFYEMIRKRAKFIAEPEEDGDITVIADFHKMSRKRTNDTYSIEDEDDDITVTADFYKMSRKRAKSIAEEKEEIGDITVIADFYKMSKKRTNSIEDEDDGDVTVMADFYKMSRKRAKSIEDEGDVSVMADFFNLSRKRAKSIEDDDDDITVMEVYKKIKRNKPPMSRRRRKRPICVKKILMSTPISRKDKEKEIIEMSSSSPISKKEEEIVEMSSSSPLDKKDKAEEIVEMSSSSPLDKKELCFLGAGHMSSEEDSEEEKKHIRRSPFVIKGLSDYVDFKLLGIKVKEKKPEVESDEELLRECDRNEVDHGYNYVLKKRWRAITNPKNPQITYYKSGIDNHPINHVLHDPDQPLATLSKLALRVYNDIQGTEYDYVGLVKAYVRFLAGRYFWIRFKACLFGQDAINFQASIFQGIRDRKTNVVPVRVEFVYPLPPADASQRAF